MCFWHAHAVQFICVQCCTWMRRTRSDVMCSYSRCRFAFWTTLKSRQLPRSSQAMDTFHLAGPIRENMLQSCQWLLCGQVKKQRGKAEVQVYDMGSFKHRTLTCGHCSIFFRSGVLPYPAQRAAPAKGTFSQNPKECLVAEEALVGHAEATKIAEADLAVTHPKHAHLQSNSSSTQ